MIFGLGMTELWLVLGVLILFFGAKRIPEMAKSLAYTVRAFKEGKKDPEEESSTLKKL